jgi:tripartite-type tricarboxylate transporter receptor subunit TctC
VGNSGTHVMNYGLYKSLPYDPINGFAPIAKMGVSPTVLIGNSSLPFTNPRELVTYAKGHSINMASPGATALFASRMFNSMAGTDITIVPYKGSAPADLSVIQNETQIAFTSLASARSHVQGGRVRMIATTSLAREPAIPNVPTLDEAGVKGYELEFWVGLFAPAGTPARIVEKVNADLAKVLKAPDVQKRLDEVGFSAAYVPTAPFAEYVKASAVKNAKLMRELGIQPE